MADGLLVRHPSAVYNIGMLFGMLLEHRWVPVGKVFLSYALRCRR